MKKVVLFFVVILSFLGINAQTFVVTDYTAPAGFSKERIQKGKKVIGKEIKLLFSDNDVKMTGTNQNGEISTEILYKKSANVYRRGTCGDPYDCNDSYDEIELDTVLGYIRGFTFTHIHHNKFGGSIVLKRK